MDWMLITILGCVSAWCGLLVLATALIQRPFSRRQERDAYTP